MSNDSKILLTMAICFIMGFGFFVYVHESVHQVISNSYGIESKIEIRFAELKVVTVQEKPCPVPECNLAHNINEIVSYPIGVIYVIVCFSYLVSFSIKQERYAQIIKIIKGRSENDPLTRVVSDKKRGLDKVSL